MRALIHWLAFTALTAAQITVPSVGKRDRPITINHPAGETVTAVFVDSRGQWMTLPDEHFSRGETQTIMAAPPGQYLLTTGDSRIIQITEEGKPEPKPNPGPEPDPTPDPDPDPPEPEPEPKLNIKWAVWIYEQADAINHPGQTATRNAIETRRFLESRGIKIAAYDIDQDKAKPFAGIANRLPALILMEDETEFVVQDAPFSVEFLKQLVTEVGSNE